MRRRDTASDDARPAPGLDARAPRRCAGTWCSGRDSSGAGTRPPPQGSRGPAGISGSGHASYLIGRLDGRRTLAEIGAGYAERSAGGSTQRLDPALGMLATRRLLVGTDDQAELARMAADAKAAPGRTPADAPAPLVDPDRFLGRLLPRVRPLFPPGGGAGPAGHRRARGRDPAQCGDLAGEAAGSGARRRSSPACWPHLAHTAAARGGARGDLSPFRRPGAGDRRDVAVPDVLPVLQGR